MMQPWMNWLNHNSGVVTAAGVFVATAGVIVAAYYAILTRRLWKTANRQADISQLIFEASNRPTVSVEAEDPQPPEIQHELLFDLILRNGGTVPAEITAWDLRPTMLDLDGKEQTVWQTREPIEVEIVGRALAPRVPLTVPVRLTSGGIHNPVLPLLLRVTVGYRGVGSRVYQTQMKGVLTGRAWNS